MPIAPMSHAYCSHVTCALLPQHHPMPRGAPAERRPDPAKMRALPAALLPACQRLQQLGLAELPRISRRRAADMGEPWKAGGGPLLLLCVLDACTVACPSRSVVGCGCLRGLLLRAFTYGMV
jgi:hypothetical protein